MKKLNILRLISTVAIAAVGVFGIANLKKETTKVKTEATAAAGTDFFLDLSSGTVWATADNWAGHFKLEFHDGSGNYRTTSQITKSFFGGNDYFYYFTTPSGYTWSEVQAIRCSSSGEGWNYSGFQTIGSNNTIKVTVDSSWNVSKTMTSYYSVTFNVQGHGSAPDTQYIKTGSKATQPANPSASGYAFGGWYQTADCTGTAWNFSSNTVTSNKILYAKWTATTYTITYDRNKNDGGSQASQTVNVGSSCTIYTPGTSPLNTSRWTASSFKRFKYWNTAWDDSGDIVNGGSSATPTQSYTLYYIEDWYDYRYRIDSGSWINLVHNDEGKGDGVLVQFAPATAQSLPLHGKISFQYSTNGGSSWTNLSSVTFEGNYDTTDGIKLETIDTIYLKISTGGSYSCWVPGISDRTIAVFDSSSATTGGTAYSMRGNGDNETVTTVDVVIEKGQFVRRGYSGNYTYGTYFAGGTGSAASCFSQVGTETAVQCLITGVYTVYNQRGSVDNWKDVYFTRNEPASAKYLAQRFNSIVGTVCTGIVGGTKTLNDLKNVWGSKSTTDLYKHFNGQITATLNYFKTTASTSDSDILECVGKYDYIIRKYGTTNLPDFIGRNNSYPTAPQGSRIIPGLIGLNDSTNTVIIIAVTSLVSVSAIGGYFFLRKRKENQ